MARANATNTDASKPDSGANVALSAANSSASQITILSDGSDLGSSERLEMKLSSEVELAARAAARPIRDTISWHGLYQEGGRLKDAPLLNVQFGNYELLYELGRGGMGVVYKARQRGLDRMVAIKMILSSHLASSAQIERFYAEARAAAKLRDPNIVAIFDVGELRGQHFFVMEYVAGESLAEAVQHGPIDPKEAARIVITVARAVHRLHGQGVVHRDLKPSNILIDGTGRPYVTDFGLAKMLGAGPQTHSGAIVGTPSYMAPEQAASRSAEVGPRSDVYSLGAILYELITGHPPFLEPNPLETLVQVLEGEPLRPSARIAKIPKPLEQICLKCLEKIPADRYQSAAELADDLERFLSGESVEARRRGPWNQLRRWARREPALATRLSALAICGSILQADRMILRGLGPHQTRPLASLVILGFAAALVFRLLLRTLRWHSLVRYVWVVSDMILFTSLVLFMDGVRTSLVAGYFLIVAASGLWFRERLVWFTTVLAVTAYGWLVYEASEGTSWKGLHGHILFMAVLALSGLIVAYQVKRVRALSHYYEHRPLP